MAHPNRVSGTLATSGNQNPWQDLVAAPGLRHPFIGNLVAVTGKLPCIIPSHHIRVIALRAAPSAGTVLCISHQSLRIVPGLGARQPLQVASNLPVHCMLHGSAVQ